MINLTMIGHKSVFQNPEQFSNLLIYWQYETEAEARETRHALHGVRWPVSNPKQLCVDFGKKEDMELAQAMSEADQIPRKTEPLKIEHSVEDWVAEQVREREHREREKEKERERERGKVKERHVPLEAVEHSRNIKVGVFEIIFVTINKTVKDCLIFIS